MADRRVVGADALESPEIAELVRTLCSQSHKWEMTYFVRSKPPSSSTSGALGTSGASTRVASVGLAAGDLAVAAGGLLLCGALPSGFDGLRSNWAGLSGVLPISAYFQNGAGELVGMCWDGRCAVLGGANFGCTRCGAGVTRDPPSSWRYDDVRVGEPGACSARPSVPDALTLLRSRGRGLPSAPTPPASAGRGFRAFRTGVVRDSRRAERGWGDPWGESLCFLADGVSLAAMSFGPWVM